jgi:uncharacterized OB-fold protein
MDNDDQGAEATFMELLAAGRLALPRCGACGRHHFPPRIVCPHCGSTRIAFSSVSGDGVVYSTTTVRNRPERGGDHNVVLVDLDEGARMMATVIECPLDEVRIGMRVRIDRARLAEGNVSFLPIQDRSDVRERS